VPGAALKAKSLLSAPLFAGMATQLDDSLFVELNSLLSYRSSGGICSLVGFGLGQINQVLAVIPALVALVLFIYLGINQKFLPFIALFGKNASF
jgi:hypothetical protein